MFFKVYVVEKIKKKNTIVFHLQCKKNDHAIVKGKVLFYLWLFAYKCLVIYIKIKTIKHVNKTKRMYLIQRQNFHNKAFVLISNTLILTYNWHKKLYPNLFFCFLNYFKINTNYLFLFQLYLFQKKKNINTH
ncbi:hypothetical protein CPARA_2gp205 (nucleomorph) [Cryptomonas paramecium]|uniref:Transmembrane protein n=1 Tax=Cryptomonas paramaecium TaxID=2898 RepID=F2HHR7_9CRYP|nr:hypothetical protein CPARA_2gp205 [Cryptomonas paramecium]AEA38863.1 hypothetical protein CPARA_2gp205 [Cryptomonas paramecium]